MSEKSYEQEQKMEAIKDSKSTGLSQTISR